MNRWQMALLLATFAAAGGLAGVAFGQTPPAAGPGPTAPGRVVEANPGWVPAGGPAAPAALPSAPPLPAATDPVLLTADFASADTGAWQPTRLVSTDRAPLWIVRDGALRLAGDTDLRLPLDEAYILAGQPTWHDLVLEASVLATSGEGAGLVWNAQGGSFYRLQLYPDLPNNAPKAGLELVRNGQAHVLAPAPLGAYSGYTPTIWQSIRVQTGGGRQQVWINGRSVFDVADATLSQGLVGLFAWADSGTRFDNVRVQSRAGR